MFHRHEILLAEGIPTESLFLGNYILQDGDLRDEVEEIFPEMLSVSTSEWVAARTVLGRHDAQMLCGDSI